MKITAHALLLAFALAGTQSPTFAATEFFVARNGNDANSGSREQPLATLEAARDAIRSLKRAQGKLPDGGVTVWILGGDYPRTRSFDLTAQDSGQPGAPVVFRALPGATVRLLGGRTLSGFSPVTDAAVLERLDEKARGKVLQGDLRATGLTNFGQFKSRGFSRSQVPSHLELFFDDQPMTVARWPNEGAWEQIAGFPEGAGEGDGHGGKTGKLADGFFYAGDRPHRWQSLDDIWVHGYWSWDWANSYERIASLDRASRLIKTAPPQGLYGFRKGQRFYFLNVLEELDQPGEWYLDREHALLYFWPPKAVASAETLVSLLEQPLVSLINASNITLRGVSLEATRGLAISIRGGASNRVAGCVLRNIGNHAIRIDGGFGHGVLGCDIENTGDGGVDLNGGDRRTLTPAGHFVENCHFQKIGRWSKCYVPAIHLVGVGLRASHNLIHDHPHCAILFNGNEHLIDFNDIHHIALETGDVGAIYTGRDYTYRGNRIRHNFIHETGGVGMGSMGIYMDDCVSGTEIYGNVFYKVQRAAFLGGGRDHQVVNNIFVDCNPAVEIDGRGLDKSPVWRSMVNEFMRRGLAAMPAALYRERYPAMKDLDRYYGPPEGPAITGDAFIGVPPTNNVVAQNICLGKWLSVNWHAKTNMLALRDNHVGQDPGFVAPDKLDFRLKPDAPALPAGFQPIPFEKIGLVDDEYRHDLGSRRIAPRQ